MATESQGTRWSHQVLRIVLPLLAGADLASCMCVNKQWRDIARDDFLWKRLCAQKWPSTCRDNGPCSLGSSRSYYKLFSTFARKHRYRPMPEPKLSFEDLEFYVDIWVGTCSVYSAIVPGDIVRCRIKNPPLGICESMRAHLSSQTYKMSMPVNPAFGVSLVDDIRMSMFIRRRDSEKIARIIDDSRFNYVDGPEHLAHAYDYLQISSLYPFLSEIRAWVALLLVDAQGGNMEVFGIELDFLEMANSDKEVLCLLEILDWK